MVYLYQMNDEKKMATKFFTCIHLCARKDEYFERRGGWSLTIRIEFTNERMQVLYD